MTALETIVALIGHMLEERRAERQAQAEQTVCLSYGGKHRTREENAGRAKWKIINERKAAKRLREGPKPPLVQAGDQIHSLTAIAIAPNVVDDGRERWVVQCTCGARAVWLAISLHKARRYSSWASCRPCFDKMMELNRQVPAEHAAGEGTK